MLLLILSVIGISVVQADDDKDRLRVSAEALTRSAEATQSEREMPLEGRRALEACHEWIAKAEEARMRRSFGVATSAQRNAKMELDIAQAYLRATRLAVTKRELDAVVQELSDRIASAGDGS